MSDVTYQIDDGQQNIATNGSGQIADLQINTGWHTLTLRGISGASTLVRTARFRVGALNLRIAERSIDYSYRNCDANLVCDVTVRARVQNTGDFDIDVDFDLRFDQLAPDGTVIQTLYETINGLTAGESAEIVLEEFTGAFDDKFTVTADPDGELVGEDRRDNLFEAFFRPAQITNIASLISDEAAVISGVTLLNVMSVKAIGGVDRVEYQIDEIDQNGDRRRAQTFIDDTGDNEFSSVIDMGLLSLDNPCVNVVAYDEIGNAADSRRFCFNIKDLSFPGLVDYDFPWFEYESAGAGRRVIMDTIDQFQMAVREQLSRREHLETSKVTLFPRISENQKVDYTLFGNSRLTAPQGIADFGDLPLVGGEYDIAPGSGLFIHHFDPSGVCDALGAHPVVTETHFTDTLDEIFNAKAAEINAKLDDTIRMLDDTIEQLIDGCGKQQVNEAGGRALCGNVGLPLGDGRFNMMIGYYEFPLVGDFISAYAFHVGFVFRSFSVPRVELADSSERFVFDHRCEITTEGDQLNVDIWARFNYRLYKLVRIVSDRQRLSAFGIIIAGLRLFDKLSLPLAIGFYNVQLRVAKIQIDIPFTFDITTAFSINNEGAQIEEGHASIRISADFDAFPLAKVDATAAAFVLGFVYGEQHSVKVRIDMTLHALAKADFSFFEKEPQFYAFYDLDVWERRKQRKCRNILFWVKCEETPWIVTPIKTDYMAAGENY